MTIQELSEYLPFLKNDLQCTLEHLLSLGCPENQALEIIECVGNMVVSFGSGYADLGGFAEDLYKRKELIPDYKKRFCGKMEKVSAC